MHTTVMSIDDHTVDYVHLYRDVVTPFSSLIHSHDCLARVHTAHSLTQHQPIGRRMWRWTFPPPGAPGFIPSNRSCREKQDLAPDRERTPSRGVRCE
jgi:hypothetical protein